MKRLTKGLIGLLALAATAATAQAAVYNPYDAAGSTEEVSFVTPGYINSWWVEDGTAGVSPTGGESPNKIRDFVEQSAITGLTMTDDGCREGLGGLNGQNKKCTGSIFAIKVNDLGYLVFQYAANLDLDDFIITMNAPNSNFLSRMDVFTPTEDVPLPGAVILLGSAIAGLGAASRRKKAKAAATA
jgi:hypothetical protein